MHIGKRLSGCLSLAAFAAIGGMVASDPAFAKVDVDKFTIGGEARVRYEYRTGNSFGSTYSNAGAAPGQLAGTTAGNTNLSYASSRVRVNVGYDLTPDVSFFAQIQDARAWGGEGGPAGATGIGSVSAANNNGTGIDLHQGYILVKNILVPGLSAKLGRQEIIFGDHRLFGNFGWSQIGNSFDAVRLTHATAFADLDLFWARIVDNDAALAGANGGVAFPSGFTNHGTADQDIYGAYLTLKPAASFTIEPYYFLLKDNRPALSTALIAPQASDQTRNTAGMRINGKGGGLDFTAEGAYQFGQIASGSFGNRRDLHINAHAEAVKVGYTFEPVPMKPRIGFEWDYASGDGDNNKAALAGNRQQNGNFNTFDNLYPTNHFHYGYMDFMAWKNMIDYNFSFDIKPTTVSKVQINFILHRLAQAGDNWYRASQGVYATTASTNQAKSLGKELDIHYFRTFKEKFKFEIGYGHFFAGEYLDRAKTGHTGATSTTTFNNNSDANWGYVMGSVLF